MPVRNKEAEARTQTKEVSFIPSTLETIDRAFFSWVDEELNIFSTTNKGWEKVPAIWVTAERSHQIKRDKSIRDSEGSIILPVMAMQRTTVAKDLANKGIYQAHIPEVNDYRGGAITVAREIKQNKTKPDQEKIMMQ